MAGSGGISFESGRDVRRVGGVVGGSSFGGSVRRTGIRRSKTPTLERVIGEGSPSPNVKGRKRSRTGGKREKGKEKEGKGKGNIEMENGRVETGRRVYCPAFEGDNTLVKKISVVKRFNSRKLPHLIIVENDQVFFLLR